MRLRRESEYGVRALVALAEAGAGAVVALDDIAVRQRLPRSFLAKIFVKFVQHGLVRSHRGAVRGYALARPPREITLRQILESIEGPDLFDRCVFENHRCTDDDPCPLHPGWKAAKSQLIEVAELTTLDSLAGVGAAAGLPAGGAREVRRIHA